MAPPAIRPFGVAFLALGLLLVFTAGAPALVGAQVRPSVFDPGVRPSPPGATPTPIAGLTTNELKFFDAGKVAFQEVDSVKGTITGTGAGLGPRFNMDSCAGCHAQPVTGGTSPAVNPQVAVAHKAATAPGATNPEDLSAFISVNGPVREVRFKTDGGVHDLFTITGRSDATGCNLTQPDFNAALRAGNAIFRIPTPTLGGGLIEAIEDSTILANGESNEFAKFVFGIRGHENREGNTGTITRFGWKAQNKSLELFAGEAYNVEQGVSNDIFPNEREENPACLFNATPEDHTNYDATTPTDALSDVDKFALFMRFLAPPAPASTNQTIQTGRSRFESVGCALCHTPSLQTGRASSAALSNQTANLFSDLLVHHMGTGLADGITQGNAQGDEFRSAPLWGLGQRIFFLHDGRTTDLLQAIRAHQSPGSEANTSIAAFNVLSDSDTQAILVFLRSL